MNRPVFCLALLAAFIIFCTACSGVGGTAGGGREHYHFNPGLGFAIDYPAEWSRQQDAFPPSVRWSNRKEGGPLAEAAVLPFFPSQVPGGEDRLEQEFKADHPGFILTSRGEEELSSTPSRQLFGHTADRTWLVYLLTTSSRAFILEFSAPPEEFAAFRSIFRGMAESFTVLE